MLDAVVGQDDGVLYLSRIIQGSLATPLLLVGNDGVGKKFSVLEAAKESFSRGDPNSPQCFQVDQLCHPDLRVIAPEEPGGRIKVEPIREVVGYTQFVPMRAPYKFILIDRSDCMTTAAANALLKVLEEAPERVRFFLTTPDETKILPTIRSRCSLVRYNRLPEDFVVSRISKYASDPTKALVCCRLSDGSLGTALQYLVSGRLRLRDQMVDLLSHRTKDSIPELFGAIDSVEKELPLGLLFIAHLLHDLTMLSVDPARVTNLDIVPKLQALAASLGRDRVGSLRRGLATIRGRLGVSNGINLSFQVKSLLASNLG